MLSERQIDRLEDIVENIDRIAAYIQDTDAEGFAKNVLVVDAVERCFQRITEASIKLGPDSATLLPSQDVRLMRDFGNLLRHDYDVISPQRLWLFIANDLPPLREDCVRALASVAQQAERDD